MHNFPDGFGLFLQFIIQYYKCQPSLSPSQTLSHLDLWSICTVIWNCILVRGKCRGLFAVYVMSSLRSIKDRAMTYVVKVQVVF